MSPFKLLQINYEGQGPSHPSTRKCWICVSWCLIVSSRFWSWCPILTGRFPHLHSTSLKATEDTDPVRGHWPKSTPQVQLQPLQGFCAARNYDSRESRIDLLLIAVVSLHIILCSLLSLLCEKLNVCFIWRDYRCIESTIYWEHPVSDAVRLVRRPKAKKSL